MIPTFIADLENKKRRGGDLNEGVMHVGVGGVFVGPDDEDENEDDLLDDDDDDGHYGDLLDDLDDEVKPVLEAGGGGPAPVPKNDPKEEAQARMMEEEAKAARAAQAEETRLRREAADKETGRTRTAAKAMQAYNDAQNFGNQQLAARGLSADNNYGVLDLYRASIDANRGRIPEITDDPYSFLNAQQAFTDAANTATGTRRRQLKNELAQFADDGFETQAFADTADDQYLNRILGEQYDEALGTVDRSIARGQLGEGARGAAMKRLEDQKRAGNARAQASGLGVLQNYRNELTNEAGRYRKRADSYELGDNFDTENARRSLEGTRTRLGGQLEGDLLNTLGGQSFFDTDTIISKAGSTLGNVNGIGNNNTGNLNNLTAFYDDRNKKSTDQSGATGNGVF
jgi:hypothetical protein